MTALVFLHTAAAHVARFDRLLAEMAPAVTARHVVRPELLRWALRSGCVGDDVAVEIAETLQAMAGAGAQVVLCTCSSIGPAAEKIGQALDIVVLRVDRALAEAAITAGPHLVVVCTVASTVAPTKVLLEDVARLKNRPVDPFMLLDEAAWPLFEAGDEAGYADHVAAAVRAVSRPYDAVMLAQASMEGVVSRLADLGHPVLASPRLGLAAALARLARAPSPQPA